MLGKLEAEGSSTETLRWNNLPTLNTTSQSIAQHPATMGREPKLPNVIWVASGIHHDLRVNIDLPKLKPSEEGCMAKPRRCTAIGPWKQLMPSTPPKPQTPQQPTQPWTQKGCESHSKQEDTRIIIPHGLDLTNNSQNYTTPRMPKAVDRAPLTQLMRTWNQISWCC